MDDTERLRAQFAQLQRQFADMRIVVDTMATDFGMLKMQVAQMEAEMAKREPQEGPISPLQAIADDIKAGTFKGKS